MKWKSEKKYWNTTWQNFKSKQWKTSEKGNWKLWKETEKIISHFWWKNKWEAESKNVTK